MTGSEDIESARPDAEPVTPEGIEALKAEIEELEGPKRREMAARIKTARELGDLSENADYHTAKEDQGHLETKILRLKERLRKAVVVEVDDDADSFAFGRSAEILDEAAGDVKTWTLVGSTEADFGEGRLSVESPVGRALRDTAVGATVTVETPGGAKRYTVQKLVGDAD
jgi:transcription elongation factor GreA